MYSLKELKFENLNNKHSLHFILKSTETRFLLNLELISQKLIFY